VFAVTSKIGGCSSDTAFVSIGWEKGIGMEIITGREQYIHRDFGKCAEQR
jgi:hypothetical protein